MRIRYLLLIALALASSNCLKRGEVVPDRFPEGRACDVAPCYVQIAIGQGDAGLLLHRGKAALIDMGASAAKLHHYRYHHAADVIERLHGRNLDYAIVTHYHQDHIGHPDRRGLRPAGFWGLFDIRGITADRLVTRGYHLFANAHPTRSMLKFQRATQYWLKNGRVRELYVPRLGETLDMGAGLEVRVVAKDGNGRLLELAKRDDGFLQKYPASENDYSLAFKVTYGPFEMFIAGDLTGVDVVRQFGNSGSSYNDIESRLAGVVGDIEVYHVSHHGSGNSTNPCFAAVLAPEVAIFPTGQNGYGHPSKRVYDLLKQRADIYITDGVARRAEPYVDPRDIVGGDVAVVIEPGGARYWVNGRPYRSQTEEEERARPDFKADCLAEEPCVGPLDEPDLDPEDPALNGEV